MPQGAYLTLGLKKGVGVLGLATATEKKKMGCLLLICSNNLYIKIPTDWQTNEVGGGGGFFNFTPLNLNFF